jgi:hypothetical protein
MTFLDDAHCKHGVLRQVGAVYQFRHLEFQRRLAAKVMKRPRRRLSAIVIGRGSAGGACSRYHATIGCGSVPGSGRWLTEPGW